MPFEILFIMLFLSIMFVFILNMYILFELICFEIHLFIVLYDKVSRFLKYIY